MKGQVSEERKKVLKRDGPWSFVYFHRNMKGQVSEKWFKKRG